MDESDEKKPKEKGKSTTQSYIIANQEVHQIKTPPINTPPSSIVRESFYQHPANRKRKLFV